MSTNRPRPPRNEARETLEAHLFRLARGDVVGMEGMRDVVSVLFSFIQDSETAQEKLRDEIFLMAQKMDVLEKHVASIPPPTDMQTVRKLVMGDPAFGIVGMIEASRKTRQDMSEMMGELSSIKQSIRTGGLFFGFLLTTIAVTFVIFVVSTLLR